MVSDFPLLFLAEFVKGVTTFYKGIPIEDYDDFTNDYAELAVKVFNSVTFKPPKENELNISAYSLVAYAKK